MQCPRMRSNEALLSALGCFLCFRVPCRPFLQKNKNNVCAATPIMRRQERVQNHHTSPPPHHGSGQDYGPAKHGTFGVQNSRDHGLRSTQRQRNARCSRPLLLRLAIIVRWCPSSRPAPCEMASTSISSRARNRILSRASGEASVARVSWKSYIGNFR